MFKYFFLSCLDFFYGGWKVKKEKRKKKERRKSQCNSLSLSVLYILCKALKLTLLGFEILFVSMNKSVANTSLIDSFTF